MKTNIDSFLNISRNQVSEKRRNELEMEEAATNFEEIFARHLVEEMTKNSFKMNENSGVMGSANNLYREHVTEALASELAKQRKLGMAELVSLYWDKSAKDPNNY